ncbi:MAG: septum site-determining protein MinC [Chloroflexi bacterium]|nr:septum site-determining protein MinC [Chloroflexota bacterium]
MMRDQTVTFKGGKDGLQVTLDAHVDWPLVAAALTERLDEQRSFFSGARVTLDVGARPMRKDELGSVKAMLERREMSLWMVMSESQTTIDSATALDLRADLISPAPTDAEGLPVGTEDEGTQGIMVRRTLRSGRTLRSQGHVVVYGDVNPGAEIIAVGDIIIWGRLRGNVHAGADGDDSAVVCALDMRPTQLRISGYISIAPPDKRHKPKPEVAFIRNRQIIVEAWR